MNTKNLTLSIAFLFTLLILSSAVTAQLIINKYTNDFTASSPNNEQIKLCSCETKVDHIIVENVGNFYGDFHVDVQGNYPRSLRIEKQDFSLAPKHFQEVLIYIEDSCGLQDTYDYDVVVTNSYGRTAHVTRSIRVDQCESARLQVAPDNRTVGLCQPATFRVNVSNVGTFADTFSLDFGPYKPTLANSAVYLNPGESYAQNVTFQFACTEYGTYLVPFNLFTDKNGDSESTTRRIDVTNQYNYAFNVSSRVDVCAQTTTQVPIAVDNIASVPDDVHVELKAPSFVTLTPDVHLEPNQHKNVTLSISPTEPGMHTITLTASDRYGNIVRERNIDLQVNNCYDPMIDMRISPEVVMTEPDTACCGPRTYYVNVRNNGDRTQTFNLKLDGPSFFVLDETTVRLEPNQNVNVPIQAMLPCSDETFSALVTVSPVGQTQVNRTAQLIVNSETQRTCHMVQIDDDELKVKETATIIPVIVKHTGIAGGEYAITVNSTIFDIQEKNITLLPGDQRAIHLIPKVNLTETEKGRYIVLPSFTFTEQSIDYNESVGVELTGKGLIERFMDWLASLPWALITFCIVVIMMLLLLIIAAVIILFMIYAGKPIFANGVRPSTLMWWKALLLVGVALLILLMLFLRTPGAEMTYERVADTTNSTVIEMYQNTEHTLDIKPYFTDPDRDELVYMVTQPRDISASIEGSMLTLRPDYNFAGENTMVITASDRKGGITDSPIFIIRVIPRKNLSLLQCMDNWCLHIVTGELIVLLLLLFLIVLTIKEYRPKPYSENTLIVIDRKQKKVFRGEAARRRAGKVVKRRTRTAAKRTTKRTVKRPVRKARSPATRARTAGRGTRALTIARGKQVARGRQVTPARGRQVVPVREPAIREFRGSGQTVNIAVGAQAHPAPAVVAVPGYQQSEIIYVGSKEGNTVHTPYCINARRIPKNKRVAYSTKREAVSAGLVPCKMCRPFEGGI